MIKLSEIQWGPFDAADPDELFTEKFVEPKEIKRLLQDNIFIISGEKGSGKTAIRQALLQKYKNLYDQIADIDFDDLEYSSIIYNLDQLSQVTNLPRLNLMTNYWTYVLFIEAMKEYIVSNKSKNDVNYGLIHDYLSKKGLIEASHLRVFLNLISHCWTFIDRFTKSKEKTETNNLPFLPSNLAPDVIEQIHKYPVFDKEFIKIREIFGKALSENNISILMILDGFDRFENKAGIKQDVNMIFESLIESVYDISISNTFCKYIKIKALIPHDRYISINLRDSDKFDGKQKSIKWSYNGLKRFLFQRMIIHNKLNNISEFKNVWGEVLPETIINPHYNVEENTFEYILRHTMYRPRQYQIHLDKLASTYFDEVIDPSMIPASIRESSKKNVDFYLKEYFIDHPNLKAFIKKFRDKENVMTYESFKNIILEALKKYEVNGKKVDDKVDDLYKMSFFGIIRPLKEHHMAKKEDFPYIPPRKHGIESYHVEFYFKSPTSTISTDLNDDDLIAIHPMFLDFADMRPHPDYIIG